MVKTLIAAVIILVFASSAWGQADQSADSYGLTSVINRLSGGTFTWTLINNTGGDDGAPCWDVLVWTLQPEGLPDPISVITPDGWEWTNSAHGRFQVASSNGKYETPPSIAPGQSLTFIYEVDPSALTPIGLQKVSFLAHIGAVLPEPRQQNGVQRWDGTTVDGHPTWFDKSSSSELSEVPEPHMVLPALMLLTAGVGLTKVIKR